MNSARQLPSVSLIITTYNHPKALNRILEAMVGQVVTPHEIIVADDGSGPETEAVVADWQKRLPFQLLHIWHKKEGFQKAKILNRAIAKASGDIVVFLDGDCVPNKRFIKDHAQLAQKSCFVQGRRAFLAKEVVEDFLNKNRSLAEKSLWQFILKGKVSGLLKAVRLPFSLIKTNQELKGILGCNLAIWREDLVKVNGYDEAFEGWGKEDSELAARLFHCGLKKKFVYGRASVLHLNHSLLPRTNLARNEALLAETLMLKKVRCEKGMNQY